MPTEVELKGIILKVAEIIIEELKLEDITAETFDPDLDLVDELGIDSMDLTTVVLVLQDEYDITIDDTKTDFCVNYEVVLGGLAAFNASFSYLIAVPAILSIAVGLRIAQKRRRKR